MSGGHFYSCNPWAIDSLADDISEEIEKLEWVEDPLVKIRFSEAVYTLRVASIMARRIDYFLSGDDYEASFLQRWDEELSTLDEEYHA